MSNVTRLVPHSLIPGVLGPIYQEVPYEKYLAEVTHFGKRGDDILYQPTLSAINTPTTVGQQWRGDIDAVDYSISQLSFPYYTIHARMEYDPNQSSKFASMIAGIGLPQFLGNLCKQGIWQRMHYASLFGFDSNQGIAKTATTETLANDSDGHSTIQTYNQGELLAALASYARLIMNSSYGMAKPVIVAAPVNMINYISTSIIPLTSYQMPGAGVDSIAGAYERVIGDWLKVGKVEFISDNALTGKGATGKDLLLFIAPGLSEQEAQKQAKNTNLVSDSLTQNKRNTFMDIVDDLKEFPNPVINGVNSSLFSLQTTSGCLLRQETAVALSYTF